MKLSSEQELVFSDWLRQKMEHHACTLCQANKWKIGEVISDHESSVVNLFDPSGNSAMVQLICKNCGHVLLFDVRDIADWHQHDASQSPVM